MFIANAAFWSLFQPIFTMLAVYSDERITGNIFGWTAPASWIGSAEPVWIILLSPLFALMGTKLGSRAPSTPMKVAIAVVGMGVAFLLFLTMAGSTGQTSPAIVVFLILAVFAMSELMLPPIGLSVTTKLAPDAFRAQMMALYFFSVGLGTSMSGVLARVLLGRQRVRVLRDQRSGRHRDRADRRGADSVDPPDDGGRPLRGPSRVTGRRRPADQAGRGHPARSGLGWSEDVQQDLAVAEPATLLQLIS